MMMRRPFMPTKPYPNATHPEGDDGQLKTIFDTLGTPTAEDWPDMNLLPKYREAPAKAPPDLSRTHLVGIGEDALALLNRLMQYNPEKRIDAATALSEDYFQSSPSPTPRLDLPFLCS